MSHDNDYGFFCDMENAKTMEYDEVEYYVVKVSKKYEVRKKLVGEEVVADPFIEESCVKIANESDIETGVNTQEKRQCILSRGCFYSVFSFLSRIPRDVYYSLVVCTVTTSCVYLVMTV